MHPMPLGCAETAESALQVVKPAWWTQNRLSLCSSHFYSRHPSLKGEAPRVASILTELRCVLWYLVVDILFCFVFCSCYLFVCFCLFVINPHTLCRIDCYIQGKFTPDSLSHILPPSSALNLKESFCKQLCWHGITSVFSWDSHCSLGVIFKSFYTSRSIVPTDK